MKINRLSQITGVNSETIRMYRKKGLLSPRQAENGYYDYSIDDLQMLLFIRKLRGSNISLDTIAYTYTHSDLDDVIEGFRREYDALEAEIEALRKRQEILKLSMDHFEEFRASGRGVSELDVADDRYDIPLRTEADLLQASDWLKNIDMCTLGVHIAAEDLNADREEPIRTELTVGSYCPILQKYNYRVPSNAIFVPKGHYLAGKIEMDSSGTLEQKQLQPLREYARLRHYRLCGPSTAFIFRVDTTGREVRYIYRLRVRVEKE